MSGRTKEQGKLFSRQDVYYIREVWDRMKPEVIYETEITDFLRSVYPHATAVTLGRVGKRLSYQEVGVGASERANVSNRLVGENRKTGDYVPIAPVSTSRGEITSSYDSMTEEEKVKLAEDSRKSQERLMNMLAGRIKSETSGGCETQDEVVEKAFGLRRRGTPIIPVNPFEEDGDLEEGE